MTRDITEAEVMGRAPPEQVFVAYGRDGTKRTFVSIGCWQAFMGQVIQWFPEDEDPALLRAFFENNEDILNDLGQQPAFAKAVGVIRAQFARAMGEGP